MLEAPDHAQSFIFCPQIMTEKNNVIFLLVNNFKMIGMLLQPEMDVTLFIQFSNETC